VLVDRYAGLVRRKPRSSRQGFLFESLFCRPRARIALFADRELSGRLRRADRMIDELEM